MSKLIVLKGLPASGKSTKAKEICAQGDWVRINRDLLREMLHFGKWSGRNEDLVVDTEKRIAYLAIADGKSVVVDDCNLNPRNEDMWREVAKDIATFEILKIDTPVDECVKRDAEREKSVGRDVIVNMALQYELFPKPEKGFVLCDLDGTLCDITHRLQYAKRETKDWDKFFAGIPEDKIRPGTIDILMSCVKKGHSIIFVSARPERYRESTLTWFKHHLPEEIKEVTLMMRRSNDKRDDVEVKQEMYNKYFKDKYPVEVVIDDRPKVIRMWRENGVTVVDVGSGEEF